MKWLIALALLAACRHDAGELAPNANEDVATWLGLEEGPCVDCLASSCEQRADMCLNDPPCRSTMQQCTPPNPGCGQRTLVTRNFASCVSDICYDACGLAAKKQACIGDYEWVAPAMSGPVEFELRLRPYQGPPWQGLARIVPCSGPTPMCDEELAAMVQTDGTVLARYNFSVTRARPYFRVTGEGLRTMLFYEDGYVYPGTQLNIPALSNDVYRFLATLLGTTLEDGKGTLDLTVYDCNGDPLAGAQLQLRRNGEPLTAGVPYYFDDAIPKPTAVYPQTSNLGQGGFVNLEPGLYDLTATLQGAPIGRIESVIVERDQVTHVNLMPLSRDEAQR